MGSKSNALRMWISDLHHEPLTVGDDTDLIQSGLITSLQFVAMVIEIERLHGERLEPEVIGAESMRTLGAIDSNVFHGA
ncbi:acyl carrier protein [Frankia sp. AgKG'84/4]|uniref:acyl carrier protein n=1 Tax=Frankia sp. AgKG'84/4 TaxID=573490 RepID=UPI0020100E6E|nr:acyl carrier protein [Frankia sp. AgKG'84/4]MCL9793444.1 acyl carrier protein [Frankia sp. AgKG'84/4]